MAKFCAYCGKPMGDEDLVCGQCGMSVGGGKSDYEKKTEGGTSTVNGPVTDTPPTGTKGTKNGPDNRIIGIAAVAVVAVIIIIVLVKVIGGGGGYKKTIDKMFKAVKNEDTETLENLMSGIYEDTYDAMFDMLEEEGYTEQEIQELLEEEGYTEEEFRDFYMESMVEEVYADVLYYDDIKKISYNITDTEEGNDELVEYLFDDVLGGLDEYGITSDFIKKSIGVQVNVLFTTDDDKYDVTIDIFLCKEKGSSGWKILYLEEEW